MAAVPRRAADRGCRAVDRRAAVDRRRVADGGRGRDDRDVQFFPSKNLGGYGDGGMMVTQDERLYQPPDAPAHARQREDVLPRGSRLQLASRRAAGGGPRAPSCHTWRTGAPARRANAAYYTQAFRGLVAARPHRRDRQPANESIFNQYTIRVRAPRRRSRPTSKREGHRVRPSTIRCRCISSPASPTWATRPASCRSPSGRPRGAVAARCIPELTRAQQDEVIAAVREFYRV